MIQVREHPHLPHVELHQNGVLVARCMRTMAEDDPNRQYCVFVRRFKDFAVARHFGRSQQAAIESFIAARF